MTPPGFCGHLIQPLIAVFPLRCLLLTLLLTECTVLGQEFRAMWADTFHAGMRNSSETTALVAAARAAHCNSIVVQVRKRGDAYYRNGLEPVATDINDSSSTFDPLADLIQKAHSGTPRVEVHAWFVTYNIWGSQNVPPTQSTHPYNLHPDWLTQSNTGATWAGDTSTSGNYQFDQGHPAVQQHTFDVIMDVLSRYDVDGIHFDYVRYSDYNSTAGSQPWGYNPVTLARYRKQKGITGTPAPTDSAWLQWRRDQVTALVRKVYLNAFALKPAARVSAALIAYGNAPANLTTASWQTSEAYSRVLQDWRGWLEEGILDLACPMIYRNQATSSGFGAWADYAKDRQFNRAAAVGMGWYLNSVANTIGQVKLARQITANGKTGAGVVGYSYGVPTSGTQSQAQVWKAFTDDATAETYDPGGTPVFLSTVSTPGMPWKTSASSGNIMGTLQDSVTGQRFDGATVSLQGSTTRTLSTDATGFFGAVDLPAGAYTMIVSQPGYRPIRKTVTVAAAKVAKEDAAVEMLPFLITSVNRTDSTGATSITWNSIPGRVYRVESSPDLVTWNPAATGIAADQGSTTWQGNVAPGASRTFLRVRQE